MKRDRFNLIMAVIYGLCAVGWIANCVKDFMYRTPGSIDGWDIALAVVWSAAFAAQLCGFFIGRKKEK
ncbi:MAG: hypothetical protein HDT33_06620 [Clostridiales bacterium]|nr:hypothetical protein [Clostridiales bacterium]